MRRLIFILRKLINPIIESKLPQMGKGCEIHPTATFIGKTKTIFLRNNVSVHSYARLFCSKEADIVIDDNTTIGLHSIVSTTKKNGFVRIGKNCSVNSFCILSGTGGLTIGNDVRIAHNVTIIAVNHVFSDADQIIRTQGVVGKGIIIDDDVWIGTGAIILDGVQIGKGSVIAAGSVVNSNVEPYTVVGGVPAKKLKSRK